MSLSAASVSMGGGNASMPTASSMPMQSGSASLSGAQFGSGGPTSTANLMSGVAGASVGGMSNISGASSGTSAASVSTPSMPPTTA